MAKIQKSVSFDEGATTYRPIPRSEDEVELSERNAAAFAGMGDVPILKDQWETCQQDKKLRHIMGRLVKKAQEVLQLLTPKSFYTGAATCSETQNATFQKELDLE
eukprot:CAMPEP_0169366780 /NCGR_PEP_ID=MMETSP1017-20121227/33305_1 /TAXON_ID=342587 /ORGANISM="Karlodinium micrum, Strain CCMP2283" /LENGTH=104 /DNA_ID=CAMNT_0009464751 /DNA_START=55 /DNA_END=368 /DNA_ORIENTATION=+